MSAARGEGGVEARDAHSNHNYTMINIKQVKELFVKALRADKRASPPEGFEALDEAYVHLTARRHTTETLARAMGVSIATAFRLVKTLRR
jgi:hypothetical protein